jgi:hypothetical protein
MDVDVEHAGNDMMAASIRDLRARRIEPRAERGNLFPDNPDVTDEGAGWSDDVTAFDYAIELHKGLGLVTMTKG